MVYTETYTVLISCFVWIRLNMLHASIAYLFGPLRVCGLGCVDNLLVVLVTFEAERLSHVVVATNVKFASQLHCDSQLVDPVVMQRTRVEFCTRKTHDNSVKVLS